MRTDPNIIVIHSERLTGELIDPFLRIFRIGIGRLRDVLAQVIDALLGERMVREVGISALRAEEFFLLQDFEELEQALRRLMARAEPDPAELWTDVYADA